MLGQTVRVCGVCDACMPCVSYVLTPPHHIYPHVTERKQVDDDGNSITLTKPARKEKRLSYAEKVRAAQEVCGCACGVHVVCM